MDSVVAVAANWVAGVVEVVDACSLVAGHRTLNAVAGDVVAERVVYVVPAYGAPCDDCSFPANCPAVDYLLVLKHHPETLRPLVICNSHKPQVFDVHWVPRYHPYACYSDCQAYNLD